MNLINKGDIIEIFSKIEQRGTHYILKKLNLNAKKRTESTFNDPNLLGSNWWIIPEIKRRENQKISGDRNITFDTYLVDRYLNKMQTYRMLSVGCGLGNREIRFAQSEKFSEILGIDLAGNLIDEANKKAQKLDLHNICFEQADFYSYSLQSNHYDIVLFHSSLHHFKNMDMTIARIKNSLKPGGLLVLNEYVGKNRLQFSKEQILEMNKILNTIPENFRTNYLTNQIKKKVYAPGLLRMIISDPSEAIESEKIIPTIHKNFKIIEEKRIGGDLLMMVLKNIAHHFATIDNEEAQMILTNLIQEEDKYLTKTKTPNFIFGVYKKQ
jgi:ubiquinone/menaquinone biosynthesis C-methylase UbiE